MTLLPGVRLVEIIGTCFCDTIVVTLAVAKPDRLAAELLHPGEQAKYGW